MSDGIALVTACFGGIDNVRQLPLCAGIDAFLYTDGPIAEAASRTWTRVVNPDYPRHDFSPRLRSRYFKHQIHRIDEVRRHRWLVWADASLQFHETAFIHKLVAQLAAQPLTRRAMFVPHPARKSPQEEYEFIRGQIQRGDPYLTDRYGREKMDEQMAWLAKSGYNVRSPLYCGGFWIVENRPMYGCIWDDWWDQNLRFGMMDQLSLGPLVHAHFEPLTFDVPLQNKHFSYLAHVK